MRNEEERFQEKIITDPLFDDGSAETRVYRQVFGALKKAPDYTLPDNFADTVLHKIEQQEQRSLLREYLWLAAGIIVLVGACVTAVVMTGFTFDPGFLRNMAGYKGLALFGAAFILFLHWIDKRLIHRHDPS